MTTDTRRTPLYHHDDNSGPATLSVSSAWTWRQSLLGSVAAAALLAGTGRPAAASIPIHDNCTYPAPNIMLCQGDQASGIAIQAYENIQTLNVNELSANIAPASAAGIFMRSHSTAALTSTLGAFKIITVGDGASGIDINAPGGVTLIHSGEISTSGEEADGVRATSSGTQDTGGNAGAVTIDATADITTTGQSARGIVAESRGNDGGAGGNVTVTTAANITSTADGIVALSTGNGSGDVTVDSTGNIIVGAYASGIAATASRGYDSNSGAISVTSLGNITLEDGVSFDQDDRKSARKSRSGGQAGITADGGSDITITSTGDITTTGDGRGGIFANTSSYSKGCDEECAETTVTVASTGDISTTGHNAFGISATTRVYGDAGDVTVDSTGDIHTLGDNSSAINAEAYGNGPVTIRSRGDLTTEGRGSNGISASTNAYGGSATIEQTGNITTQGHGAIGIEASSSGNGVSITNTGDIATSGDGAAGISVNQERGKYAFFNEPVTVTSTGNITTTGDDANGIEANNSTGDVTVDSTGNISAGAGSSGIVALATSDFFGEDFGRFEDSFPENTGNVTVTSTGNITLTGENDDEDDKDFFFPSAGILAAGSGEINIASTGNISTTGADRGGILAISAPFFFFGPYDCYDDECELPVTAPVTVTSVGDIATTGDNAFAIGAVSFGGDVTVTSTGNVSASGANASAIIVQSGFMNEGGTNTTVNILGGTVSGGGLNNFYGGSVASVQLGGGNVELNNHGTITGGGSGTAVYADATNGSVVNNDGTIAGNVYLGGAFEPYMRRLPADNTFNNNAGGTFNTAEDINLASRGTLNNKGRLSPGGNDTVQTTTLWGNLVQGVSGILGIDLDHAARTSDRLEVEGEMLVTKTARSSIAAAPPSTGSATLDGKVAPHLLTYDPSGPNHTFTILTATGGVVEAGLSVVDTALVDYAVLYPDMHTVQLGMTVDLSGRGLTANQAAVVGLLGTPGGAAQNVYLALLNAPDLATLAGIADALAPSNAAGSGTGALQAGTGLANALRSCPVADGPYAQLQETACLWAKPTFRRFEQDQTASTADIRDNTSGISGGFQTAVGENLWGGFGASFEESNTLINGSTKTDGTWWQVGSSLKWVDGPMKISASISGGQADLDTVRATLAPGITADSSTTLEFGTGLVRFAYTFGDTGLYVTPMFDVAANYLSIDGYTETSSLGLTVAGTSEWIFAAGPAVEIGSTIHSGNLTFRPYVKAGVTFLSDDAILQSAHFAGSSVGFIVASGFDNVYADLTAGVQLFSAEGINLRFNYEGKFGETSEQHGVDAKLTVNY